MNIILIGMPGCGKSTCGVLTAKIMCKSFLDTDLVIQQNENMKLQEIINSKGTEYFAKCEENAICGLYTENCVIATGGSVVYSDKSMQHLKSLGKIIYMHIDYDEMRRRIKNPATRGILLEHGSTLMDMYNERIALYEKYADRVIDVSRNEIEQTAQQIIQAADGD